MRMKLRVGRFVSFGAALFVAFGVSMHARAQEDFSAQTHQIFELTNQDREARGLQPLQWNTSLAQAAQAHAERMAAEDDLSHQYPGEPSVAQRTAQAGAHFQAVAENIASGYSARGIESEWMHSTPHRTNILDPRMNALGVGLVERRGTLFAVEDFADASGAFSPGQVESQVGRLLRQDGIDPSAPRAAAALACSSDGGYPKGETGKLVVRFDTGDLSQLPAQIQTLIRSGSYHRAAVAACPGGRQGSFTTYKVALVLY